MGFLARQGAVYRRALPRLQRRCTLRRAHGYGVLITDGLDCRKSAIRRQRMANSEPSCALAPAKCKRSAFRCNYDNRTCPTCYLISAEELIALRPADFHVQVVRNAWSRSGVQQ